MANFKTRARAVDLLGKQQIRDEVTAISELLRNSYDADSSEGLVDVDTKQGRIVVWDDGDGMEEKEIQEYWLTLGTYSKAHKSIRPTAKGRVKIGEKGIGRLAISLLGDQLLLITKKRQSKKWAYLYLHWDFFRNENAYLEEIEIPTDSFNTYNELLFCLCNDFKSVKEKLLVNINNISDTNNVNINKIKENINGFKITDELIKHLQKIEKRGGGTCFYITNLDTTWDWDIYHTKIKDERLKRRNQRLKDITFSFVNLIDVFDNELSSKEERSNNSFAPKVHIDGYKLEDETWFNPEDMNLYDYALKGTIEAGYFSGEAYIHNLDGVQITPVSNINLTSGMYIDSLKDCGPVKLKWYFLEGQLWLSCLAKEQFTMMSKKLSQMGGIFVYRDGLRILPYGELGNDFLSIEERRTRGAGYYLFSHRRMFGFMEISKEKNPGLIDKSSREGFIENKEFAFFKAVAENLLIWWARDFLESSKYDGRRGSRNQKIKEEFDRKVQILKLQKEEDKRTRQYFASLNNSMSSFYEKLEEEEKRNKSIIKNQINVYYESLSKNVRQDMLIDDLIFNIKKDLNKIANSMDSFKITINPRYLHQQDLIDDIEDMNYSVNESKLRLSLYVDELIIEIRKKLEEELRKYLASQEIFDQLNNRIISSIKWIDEYLNISIGKIGEKQKHIIDRELSGISKKISIIIDSDIKEKGYLLEPVCKELRGISIFLENCHKRLESFDLITEPEKVVREVESTLNDFSKSMLLAQDLLAQYEQEIRDSSKQKAVICLLTNLQNQINDTDNYLMDDEYIGLLKKEVDMYRDLSAVGLAAELTSHEFNTLFSNISSHIKTLNYALKNTKALPYVEQIQRSFNSLERLYQRMSPLYRQNRNKPRDIVLKELLSNICEYFQSDISRYNIKVVMDIPEKLKVKEIEAILYTPILNLLSNAIYWVMNAKERKIVFYTSQDSQNLYIHDSGSGISDKDRDRIFEPFFTRRIGGRGLGLFLSRDILESSGYQLINIPQEEAPRAVGGACFCIRFKENVII